jgi:hypothetical protein
MAIVLLIVRMGPGPVNNCSERGMFSPKTQQLRNTHININQATGKSISMVLQKLTVGLQ